MVMVLLFLGVVFLLVGFQAMGSGDDSSDDDSPVRRHHHVDHRRRRPSIARTGAPRPMCGCSTSPRSPGAAEGTATRLRDAGWNVTETGNLTLTDVTATTVYFSDAPGEREAADEVGKLLEAPVEPRVPEVGRAATGRDRGGHRLGSRTCSSSASPLSPPCSPCPSSLLSACSAARAGRHAAGHHAVGLDRVAVAVGAARRGRGRPSRRRRRRRREADRRPEGGRRHHGRHRRLRVRRRLRHRHRQDHRPGKLTPGFHGLHIHSVGKCEANSVAPTGGAPGDFNSAGGHFQVPGHSGHPASGDLTLAAGPRGRLRRCW